MTLFDRIASAFGFVLNRHEWHQALAVLRKETRAGRLSRDDARALYGMAKAVKERMRLRRQAHDPPLPPWPKVLTRIDGVVVRSKDRVAARMFD